MPADHNQHPSSPLPTDQAEPALPTKSAPVFSCPCGIGDEPCPRDDGTLLCERLPSSDAAGAGADAGAIPERETAWLIEREGPRQEALSIVLSEIKAWEEDERVNYPDDEVLESLDRIRDALVSPVRGVTSEVMPAASHESERESVRREVI